MKIDFSKILEDYEKRPIKEFGIREAILSVAVRIEPKLKDLDFAKWEDIAKILDDGKISFKQIMATQGQDVTLRLAAVRALGNETALDKDGNPEASDARGQRNPIKGEEKVRRGYLADKIYGCAEPIELKLEDRFLIKSLIALTWSSLITYRAWGLIDPAEAEGKK